jgi:hypothetical protein
MAIKSQDVLKRLNLGTNINNTNNTNNTNNITTSMFVQADNQVEENTTSSSLGLASLSASQKTPLLSLPKELHFSGGNELPPAWLNFKWDLFKNPTGLKLACNIIKLDGTKQSLTAALNSPQNRLWRKVEDRTSGHWQLVQEQYDLWREVLGPELEDFRASKLCLPGKKGSVEICVFMAETLQDYSVRMLYRNTIYDYTIPKSSTDKLTIKQITSNQIATLFIGKKAQAFVSLDDLGI